MKKKLVIPIFLILMIWCVFASPTYAQQLHADSLTLSALKAGSSDLQAPAAQEKTGPFRNSIRFNLSGPFIFGSRYLVFGYERMIKSNQAASINIGRMSLPEFSLTASDSASVAKDSEDQGFHVSADYRFYLNDLNRHEAPRGVYIGPYYSYNEFSRENIWTLSTTTSTRQAMSNLDLKIHTIGLQLGYQFVFWNRLSLDMVLIGPGVANYDIKGILDPGLPPEDRTLLLSELRAALENEYPGLDRIIEGNFEREGSTATWKLGYRYLVHLGFRF